MQLSKYLRPNASSDEPKGLIKYHDLIGWWQSFTPEERAHIIRTYQPMGVGIGAAASSEPYEDHLTRDDIDYSSGDTLSFLVSLSGWFNNKRDRHLARRILDKAAEFVPGTQDVLSIHFFHQAVIETYYPDRDTSPEALPRAIQACKDQIDIAGATAMAWKREFPNDMSLPGHKGYDQLAIILEKQQRYAEAIALAQQAKKQGWAGDWDGRIARCTKRLSKIDSK